LFWCFGFFPPTPPGMELKYNIRPILSLVKRLLVHSLDVLFCIDFFLSRTEVKASFCLGVVAIKDRPSFFLPSNQKTVFLTITTPHPPPAFLMFFCPPFPPPPKQHLAPFFSLEGTRSVAHVWRPSSFPPLFHTPAVLFLPARDSEGLLLFSRLAGRSGLCRFLLSQLDEDSLPLCAERPFLASMSSPSFFFLSENSAFFPPLPMPAQA